MKQNAEQEQVQEQEQEQARSPVTVSSLDELQQITEAPLYCAFNMDGRPVRIPCRRLTSAVEEQVRAIRREAQPPFKKELNNYDFMDRVYLTKKEQNEKVARALIVYTGCPMLAEKKPGLTDKESIYAFVKSTLPEMVLELIALTVTASGISVAERANFTSPSALES